MSANEKRIWKFFEDTCAEIDLKQLLIKDVETQIVYNGAVWEMVPKYSDPNLQLTYEVIES